MLSTFNVFCCDYCMLCSLRGIVLRLRAGSPYYQQELASCEAEVQRSN